MEYAVMKLILLNAFMMEVTVVDLASIQIFVQSAHVMKKLILQLTCHVRNTNPELIFTITKKKIHISIFEILRL